MSDAVEAGVSLDAVDNRFALTARGSVPNRCRHSVLWAPQSAGPQTRRLTEFAPVLLIQLYVVFLRGGFDAFPAGVAFSVGHPLHLLKTGDCVAHVSSVMDGFFTFLGKSEVLIGDIIAASFTDLGHAS